MAFDSLANAVGAYLETIGWRALVVGSPQVRGFDTEKVGHFEFVVSFTGGKRRARGKRGGGR